MKHLLITRLFLLLVAFPILFNACKKEEDDDPIELLPKLEGMYIYGSNTVAATSTDPNARMARAQLVPDQGAAVDNLPGVYGKIMYIGANSTIKLVEVVNEVAVKYGAENGGTRAFGPDIAGVPVRDTVVHGTLLKDGADIKVVHEGLYYAYVDANTKNFVLMQIKPNMIGDATPLDWSGGTPLAMISTNKDSTVFESTIALKGAAGYRYRFNDGWNVFTDGNIVTMASLGVPDYGVAWDTGINDLGFYLSNIPNKVGGSTKVRLVYDAKTTEWTETKITSFDGVKLGLFGNAFTLPGGAEANWDLPLGLKDPVVAGSVYTWTWDDVALIQGREFVINQDGGWAGLIIDFGGATHAGTGFTTNKIVDARSEGLEFANYFVKVGGNYKIVFAINGSTGVRTLTIDSK
jgi:hypothetical protein